MIYSPFLKEQSRLIVESYEFVTGRTLRDVNANATGEDLAQQLYESEKAVLSHDRIVHLHQWDNIYNYANQTALKLFERTFEQQVQLFSTRSAGADHSSQNDRNSLLAQCLAKGYVEFDGERVSASGNKVVLKEACLFNLIDDRGIFRGQAVIF